MRIEIEIRSDHPLGIGAKGQEPAGEIGLEHIERGVGTDAHDASAPSGNQTPPDQTPISPFLASAISTSS